MAGPKKIITSTLLTGNRVYTYADILKHKYSSIKQKANYSEKGFLQPTEEGQNKENSENSADLPNITEETNDKVNGEQMDDPKNRPKLESALLQRIIDMENKQAQIEKTQEEIRVTQAAKESQDDDKLADTENTEQLINEIVDKKVTKLQQDYTTKIEIKQREMQSKLDTILEDKVEQISLRVANQVAFKFMEILNGYGQIQQTTETQTGIETKVVPLITQESPARPSPQRQIGTKPWNVDSPMGRHVHSKVNTLKNIQDTDVETSKNCSPHDNNLEQERIKKT